MIPAANPAFSPLASPVSSDLFYSTSAAEQGGGIPWWIWALIVILLLLIALWWWMRRPSQEDTTTAQSESESPPQVAEKVAAHAIAAPPAEQPAPPAAEIDAGTPQPAALPVPLTPDDLTRVAGIGPKISIVLKAAGITTFTQLARTEASQVQQVLVAAGIKTADPGTWGEQAKLAAAGEWGALRALQDQLQGGRRM